MMFIRTTLCRIVFSTVEWEGCGRISITRHQNVYTWSTIDRIWIKVSTGYVSRVCTFTIIDTIIAILEHEKFRQKVKAEEAQKNLDQEQRRYAEQARIRNLFLEQMNHNRKSIMSESTTVATRPPEPRPVKVFSYSSSSSPHLPTTTRNSKEDSAFGQDKDESGGYRPGEIAIAAAVMKNPPTLSFRETIHSQLNDGLHRFSAFATASSMKLNQNKRIKRQRRQQQRLKQRQQQEVQNMQRDIQVSVKTCWVDFQLMNIASNILRLSK